MQSGFTTGSCAAAASAAAAFMLFSGEKINTVTIMTPAGVEYRPEIVEIEISSDFVSCGIVKFSGDDPDITNGTLICSKVEMSKEPGIHIVGGAGVGVVTRPGLEMPVGSAAINSTPRRMITEEVQKVLDNFDYEGGIVVTIFVPMGEELALKTFNPHMGIEGGISILGTSGIVEPMSTEALKKTIELDISMKYQENPEVAILVPGNYGENFLVKEYGIDPNRIIHFSNYVGFAIDKAKEIGFKKVLFVGHTGKLVKVSGGIMNTHSSYGDARMELMSAALVSAAQRNHIKIDVDILEQILEQVTTTGVLAILDDNGLLEITCKELLDKILYHLRKRGGEDMQIECILYENSFGLLAQSQCAKEFI